MLIMYTDYWLRLEIFVGLLILFYIIYFSKVELYTNYGLREYIKKNKSLHPNSISNWRKYYGPPITILFFIALYFNIKPIEFFCIEAFVFLAITDMLDGDIARTCGLTSEEGEALDAEADKWLDLPPLQISSYLISPQIFVMMTIVSLCDIYGQKIRGLYSSAAASKIGKLKTTIKFALVYLCTFKFRYEEIHIILNLEEINYWGFVLTLITAFVSMFLKTKLYNKYIKEVPNDIKFIWNVTIKKALGL